MIELCCSSGHFRLLANALNLLILAPKELLMFFPQDYSSVKLSKNKILGTAQQRGSLQENTWIEADIGCEQPWKGLIIKTG